MAIKIGSLLIRLAVEHGILQEGLTRAERDVAKTTKEIRRRGQEIADFGQKMSLAVTLPMAAIAKSAVNGFIEQEKAMADVTAALASMGGVSGKTAEDLAKTADALEMRSLFDAEVILKQVTAQLLTFGNVAGREFDRAQQAALDMATRLGGDPQAAAIMLGKALQDPIRGLTALGKTGAITRDWVAANKERIKGMVEEGRIAEAQGLILSEVEKQVAGAAQAAADASPWRQAQVAIGQAMDAIGKAILPAIAPAAAAIAGLASAFASMPEPLQTVVIALGAFAAIVGPIAIAIGAVITGVSGLAAALGGLPALLATIKVAFTTLMISPLGLVVAAIGAVVAAWYYWDEIKGIVGSVGSAVSGWWSNTVAPALSNVGQALKDSLKWWVNLHVGAVTAMMKLGAGVREWLVDKLGAIFDWVGRKIQQVTGFFFDMYDAVVGNSYVPDMVDGIAVEFARLQAAMVDPAKKATASVTEDTRKMAQDVMGLLDRLFPEMARARKLAEELALIDAAGLSESARSRARLRLLGEGSGGATVSSDLLSTGPLVDFGQQMEEMQRQLGGLAQGTKTQTVQIAESFRDMAERSIQSLERMVGAIKGGGFLDILGSAVNLFLQLGSTGLFGKSIAANINAPRIPGNANGTAYHPGGLMTVGERGPELLMAPRGSRVIPNHELREAGAMAGRVHVTVGIDETGNLRAAVEPMVRQYSGMAAQAGAAMAQSQMAQRSRRRVR